MSDDHPQSNVYSDDNDNTTFAIDDDDEAVIEECDDDDDDIDGSIDRQDAIDAIFADEIGSNNNNNRNNNGHVVDDYNVHDQLPSVEEVKASNAYLPASLLLAKSHRRKLYIVISAAALAAIILSVVITIGVSTRGSSSSSSGSINSGSINSSNGSLSSIKDGSNGIYKPDPSRSRLENVIQFVFANKVSPLPALESTNSAEHYAAVFIAEGDAFHSEMDNVTYSQMRKFLERYILALLFYNTSGDMWQDRYNFLSRLDHCEWNKEYSTPQGRFMKGVQCNNDGFVVDIDLSNNNLASSHIPNELKHIFDLEVLHMFGNTIGGTIPNLSALKKLKSVGLMNLDLVGTIPSWFGDLTALTTLALGQNKFTNSIPESFVNLKQLRILSLDNLGLTGNLYPIKKLSALEALYLEDNHLSGEIYDSNWPLMKELDISNNMIDGRIPTGMFQNTHLRVLDLHRNLMFGDFPTNTIANDSIEYVALHSNSLSGSISDRIGYLDSLKHLDVASNQLTGSLPDTIQLLTNLVSLSTSGNKFSKQPMVDYFTSLTELQDLSMKGNSFTGTLPDFFAEMSNLRMLDLDGNELSGSIPTWYGIMTNLAVLQLNRNELTGTVPSQLGKMPLLQILLLDGNNLTGNTGEICAANANANQQQQRLVHFITDCYPGKNGAAAEISCSCCTLCCNDNNPDCNNKDWTSNYDPKSMYGYIRPAYEFSLDQAPEGWAKTAQEEAKAPANTAGKVLSSVTHSSSF